MSRDFVLALVGYAPLIGIAGLLLALGVYLSVVRQVLAPWFMRLHR